MKNKNIKKMVWEERILNFPRRVLSFNLSIIHFPFLIKTVINQKIAAIKRKKNLQEGVQVPPVLALSITNKCNLDCTGCYAKIQRKINKSEFTDEEIIQVLSEAKGLGVSMVLLLGGEPFVRDVFKLTRPFKNMVFVLYTNATLLTDSKIQELKSNNQILPMLSMEAKETDERRGAGVLSKVMEVSNKLYKNKILYGFSLTVTRNNFDEVCNDDFVNGLIAKGCMAISYFKYVPIENDSIDLTLTPEQNKKFREFILLATDNRYKSFIISPEAEIKFGGCFGAGKGVMHINTNGNVEPCPFVPYSDVSIKDNSLKEVLQSSLFHNLRKHHKTMINQDLKMCSLWEDEKWSNAIKTNDFSFLEKKEIIKLETEK